MAAHETLTPADALAGIGVLVTRPAHQAEALAALIEQAGGRAICFPTIEIAPPCDPEPLLAVLDRLTDYDLAVFVSVNAVEQAFAWLRARRLVWPAGLAAACVGKATAAALAARGVAAIAPPQRFNSESLLALPPLQQVAGKKVVIFRGDGGRELLAETLAARGATITYAECYRRVRPQADPQALIEHWRRGEIHVVVITSTESLHNLFEMLGETGRTWLTHSAVVVLSETQARACRELGFSTEPLIAAEASDAAIFETIRAWRRARFSL